MTAHDACLPCQTVFDAPAGRDVPRQPSGASGLRVLIVDDDPALIELLTGLLEDGGYVVASATQGDVGLATIRSELPDLVLLDWMMPEYSGIEVCRAMRESRVTAATPVIMLTGRTAEVDRIRAFEAGVDDFISKPFSTRELLARIRTVMRYRRPMVTGVTLSWGDIVMDTVAHRVVRGGIALTLKPIEFRLLQHLMERPNQVLSRKQLLSAVWGRSRAADERTVDAYIGRLRRAIDLPDTVDVIRTARHAGYCLSVDPSQPRPAALPGRSTVQSATA